jgi:two-component system, chemotaxis family, chemotaxis protein CheY
MMATKAAAAEKTVLIVEDDKDIRESIAALLADVGISTQVAENGAVAVELLSSGQLPHLILLDLMMPVMDGFAFREAQASRPEWDAIPVVVMSADGNLADKKARARASDYLHKPVDIDRLLASVRSLIR